MKRFRRSTMRASVAWLGLLSYVWASWGFALDTPTIKDLSRPFLCMHSQCGCHSAEQCYRSCCCHSAAERLAFAKAHGVTPPPELMREATAPQCGEKKSCCAERRVATQQDDAAARGTQEAARTLMKTHPCRGPAKIWLQAGAALPLEVACEFLALECVDLTRPVHVLADSLLPPPPAPPPRVG